MFDKIEEAIEAIKNGEIIIVLDDEDRENEGDFVMAANKVTPEAVNFMTKYGRGIICAPVTEDRAKQLGLDFMVGKNTSSHETAFTVSVDIDNGSTGVSSEDRSLTIQKLSSAYSKPQDFIKPGHVFPLIAKKGGVVVRPGHTEASVDLSSMANLDPSAVICEIMSEDGSMARRDECLEIAKKNNMKIITIKDLIKYRHQTETLIELDSSINFPNKFGDFKLHLFKHKFNPSITHLAISKGDIYDSKEPVLTRIHSECFTGDIFGSFRCDCGDQLSQAMKLIEKNGAGLVVYLKQEGRGIGLENKLKAYEWQDKGLDTVAANHQLGFKADLREYSFAAQILNYFKVRSISLLTNNPLKLNGLKDFNINIAERLPLQIQPNEFNERYLQTKRDKLGHLMDHLVQ